jgi:hypothetical protein
LIRLCFYVSVDIGHFLCFELAKDDRRMNSTFFLIEMLQIDFDQLIDLFSLFFFSVKVLEWKCRRSDNKAKKSDRISVEQIERNLSLLHDSKRGGDIACCCLR